MIIVRLSSGLGNQMFQYALGRHLTIKNNTDLKLYFSSNEDAARYYALGVFNIVGEFAAEKDWQSINLPNMKKLDFFSKLKRKAFRWREQNKSINEKKIILEPYFQFCPDILKARDNCYLSGNWQSEKYFNDSSEKIKNDFTLKDEPTTASKNWIKKINSCNSVSLHIRRGDYVSNQKTNQFHGTCGLEYYQKAIDAITTKTKNPEFFIFSDDIEWAKNNLKIDCPIYFVSDKSIPDYEELIIMSKCRHNIIANSSFSWWGAWLNNNQDKIVIAPQKWFNAPVDTSDLIPNSWTRL